MNDRVVQPWRTTFSQRPGISFRIREQLGDDPRPQQRSTHHRTKKRTSNRIWDGWGIHLKDQLINMKKLIARKKRTSEGCPRLSYGRWS